MPAKRRLVTARTAIVNQVRGLLRERGLVFGSGRMRFERYLREQLIRQEIELNPVCRALFATLAAEYEAIDTRIEEIDAELSAFAKSNPACTALLSVPGVGVIVVRIPKLTGRAFRFEAGRHSGMKPATIPINIRPL